MKRIAVLTSGGDAPGMNAAIRSVVRTALASHLEIYGIYRGYSGLIEDDMVPMNSSSVSGIILRGGTILKTARCKEFFEEFYQKKGADILRKRGIDGLIVIGGDGSIQGAEKLTNLGIPTVTMPGTIDNDMHGTDETIGHDTAVNAVVSAVSRIRDTASAHNRAAIVEVMGRFAGNIALDAGLACGAEYILVPEVPFSREKLARSLKLQMEAGRTNSIIICAEGADDGRALGDWLKERTDIDICTTILGFIQRGGQPTARDGQLASILGAASVRALLDGETGALVGTKQGKVIILPYAEAKKIKEPFREQLYNLAVMLGAAQNDGDVRETGL
ncbi:ATP-dependent 6-phosphofructokinase [Dialister sp.]|uniref:ATP-dependent 6-phosphofructokinase n=1 Tax=Dialister sp. TaxID=1955814 RepID=UPI002E80B73B|nr:ATP-dependent 6-phosphofructokinase [Dialister sp.]MEE3453899.1 ATP-dependent 6-phosphofructokinase [Dialister sp.]